MIPVFAVIVIAAYGIWYGLFTEEFKAVHPWTGRARYSYKPKPYQRIIVVAGSFTILLAAIFELIRLWKSN